MFKLKPLTSFHIGWIFAIDNIHVTSCKTNVQIGAQILLEINFRFRPKIPPVDKLWSHLAFVALVQRIQDIGAFGFVQRFWFFLCQNNCRWKIKGLELMGKG